ncbi:hypothetical protein KIN20_011579 [Parelaphostrongylus tenuis]|uniref:Kinetochore protein Nuf2 N-terminal domain-containing protein n=1 Tax=Parelaphostrongylus tenuis TaxID=148309 RepID=A0AAD5MTT3_PARTN|nr:hypothetical protein KIN20_011579 [Parelaphostrongylus tenuis]
MRCFTTDFGDESCDFTMCDLVNPQPKRTRRLLSLLADFTNFNMKASHVFEKTVAEYDEARQVVNAAQEQVRLAEERRNALRSGLDLRKRKENEVLVELSAKQRTLKELLKAGEINESRKDEVWTSMKNSKQKIVDLKKEIESIRSKTEHVSKGIVKSPARFLRDVEDQRAQIKSLQGDCDRERERIYNNEESMKVIDQISKMLDERHREMDVLSELQRLVVCGEEEAKNHEGACELGSSRLKDLRSLKENLSSVLQNLRENDGGRRNELSQLKKVLVRLRNENSEEKEIVRAKCLELQRRFKDLLQKYHREEEKFISEYRSFSDVLCSISSAIDDANQAEDGDEVM